MMPILWAHYEVELSTIEREILEINAKLAPFTESEIYRNILQNLQTTIEILNRDIVKGKEKKFQRDPLAFNLGRASKWDKVSKTNIEPGASTNVTEQQMADNTTNAIVSNVSSQTTCLPHPPPSSLQIDDQNISKFSTYTMDDDNLDSLSTSKRKKMSPTVVSGVGDSNAPLFSFSKASTVVSLYLNNFLMSLSLLFSTYRYTVPFTKHIRILSQK